MSFARAAEGQNKVADDVWWHPSVQAVHTGSGDRRVTCGWKVDEGQKFSH